METFYLQNLSCSTKSTLQMLVNTMNLWKKGHQAVFNFNCRNGLAWMNVSASLNEERDEHAGNQRVKKKQPSPSKRKRNALRAAKFREKSRLQNSETSSKSQSQCEVQKEIPNVNKAVTDHPTNNDTNEAVILCEK